MKTSLFFLITFFWFSSYASVTKKDLFSTAADLPPKIFREIYHIIDQSKIVFSEDLKTSNNREGSRCFLYKSILKKSHKNSPPQKIHVFSVNTSCEEPSQREEIYKELVRAWLEVENNPLSKIEMKQKIYENSFFYIHQTVGLNPKQSFSELYLDFWTSSIKAYKEDSRFISKHPDLYILLRNYVFEEKDNFSESRVDPYIFSTRSVDLYQPTARVKYISRANESWFQRYEMINRAKESIQVQYFGFDDDVFGMALGGLLLEALERGVSVDIMVDGRGSLASSRGEVMKALVSRGARVVSYNPMLLSLKKLSKFFKVGLVDAFIASNHDKILLVDEKRLLTGGTNVDARYFTNASENRGDVFKDADVYALFDKPFTEALSAFYVEFYSKYSIPLEISVTNKEQEMMIESAITKIKKAKEAIEDRMFNRKLNDETLQFYPELEKYRSLYGYLKFDPNNLSEPLKVRGLDKTSQLLNLGMMREKIFSLIQNAKQEIVIENPYLFLTNRMEKALVEAANRGVRIILHTSSPTSTDSHLTQAYLAKKWKHLLKKIENIEIYAVKGPEKLHAKILIFDNNYTVISGYNFDALSEKHNSEFGLLIESESFASQVRKDIFDYKKLNSIKYEEKINQGPYSIEGSEKYKIKLDTMYWISMLISDWV